MIGLGERLRSRARDLGLSDAAVARKLHLGQTRYANYITDRHEPDLATLVRICAVLRCSPSELLAWPAVVGDDEAARLSARIGTAIAALETPALSVLSAVADGLVATTPLKREPRLPRTRKPEPHHGGEAPKTEA